MRAIVNCGIRYYFVKCLLVFLGIIMYSRRKNVDISKFQSYRLTMRNAYSVEMGPLYLLYVCIDPFNLLILNQ